MRKWTWIVWIGCLLALAACSGSKEEQPGLKDQPVLLDQSTIEPFQAVSPTGTPELPLEAGQLTRIIHHEALESPPLEPFPLPEGCQMVEDHHYECSFSAAGGVPCDTILQLPVLGALDPSAPIAQCVVSASSPSFSADGAASFEAVQGLYETGCSVRRRVRLIRAVDGAYELIDTPEKLQALALPIDSAQKALAYARAVTPYFEAHWLEIYPGYDYEVPVIEETNVSEVDGGFQINLFDASFCGCGPHYTSGITLTIAADGTWQESKPASLYRDPANDALCVD